MGGEGEWFFSPLNLKKKFQWVEKCINVWTSVFFFIIGEFSANFDLENMISSYRKGFFRSKKNGPNSPDFEEKKFKSLFFL